jgi:TonB-dependent SusC/RagA subfamily outer membrane receptor
MKKIIIITLIILYKCTSGLAQKTIPLCNPALGEQKLQAALEAKPQAPTRAIIKICSPSRHSLANPPLFILDGMELAKGDSLKIEPRDIESISVLKDKKAIEPYGKKGENGVIIITSKKK